MSQLDDSLTGHSLHCPKCGAHLTSLLLCPECGLRYGLLPMDAIEQRAKVLEPWVSRAYLAERRASALEAELAEWQDERSRILAEACAPDETHCACVPVLRRNRDDLQMVLSNMIGWAETLQGILQEELEHNTKPEEEEDMQAVNERLTDDIEMALDLTNRDQRQPQPAAPAPGQPEQQPGEGE